MKSAHENIDQILPCGELIRGFAAQSTISKGELKSLLRSRGIFFNNNDKEYMIPCLTTLLLSPSEFETLKDCQNSREDNPKKSSSRIELNTDVSLLGCMPQAEEFQSSVVSEYVNYELTKPPQIFVDNPNKIEIFFELERYDRNKSWYEAKNIFIGNLVVEKLSSNEISFTKSYTSPESEEVANRFQQYFVQYLKSFGVVDRNSELRKILFKDFTNEERIHFFWRLTYRMEGIYFEFADIIDMEFRPDESQPLPEKIDWMARKKELILKGTDIHNTFFIKEEAYYPHLQFWSLEAKFKYTYNGGKGTCNVNFNFKDFIAKEDEAEFEINIPSLTCEETLLGIKDKNVLKQSLLNLLEVKKNEIYHSFIKQIKEEQFSEAFVVEQSEHQISSNIKA